MAKEVLQAEGKWHQMVFPRAVQYRSPEYQSPYSIYTTFESEAESDIDINPVVI